ncbi:MAG: 50S ribosomal protein L19 [Candidatus Portnoybacteria bacterium]|nr:50S ribosomal protein L19 [Candidatus Portnoybacteria bacterium]
MTNKLDIFNKNQTKKEAPDIKAGDVVRVHLKLPEKTKKGGQKTQVFEGLVIARKHGKGINSTITVRKISGGVGIERIFPIHCPTITKIELVKRSKVRRSKLYYMRERTGKKARMKTKELLGVEWAQEEEKKEEPQESKEEKSEETEEKKENKEEKDEKQEKEPEETKQEEQKETKEDSKEEPKK